jgi:hypothetical protein
LVLLAYVLFSLAMSYPMPLQMGTRVAGRHMDTRVFQWNNWWLKEALANGLDLYFSEHIYYPSGASLVGHNFNWVSSFLSVPLDYFFGAAVAYNLLFLLTIFLSAFGAYVLVLYLTGRRDAAFVAGLAFGFAPYHISGNWAGQLNLANTQWLPFAVLFLMRTVDRKSAWDAVLAGVFFALASLDCWFFMVFLAMWAAVYLVYSLLLERHKWRVKTVGLLLLAAVLAGLLIAPFLWPVLSEGGEGTVADALDYYESAKSTDLLAFLVPDRDHTLLNPFVADLYERFSHWRPAFLGYTALALALYAAIALWRRSILWVVTGLLFALLALGTVLRIRGVEYPGVPMPYDLLSRLVPAFKLVRQANRFNVMVSLSLSVLVGLACADLFAWLEQRASPRIAVWGRYAAVIALSAMILYEYLALPLPTLPFRVSPFYERVAQEDGDFALVELPLDHLYNRRSLYAQTFHGKKLVNGYLARAATEAEAFVYSNPLLKVLRLRMTLDPTLYDIPAQMDLLAANDIRYIVIHKAPMPPHPALEEDVLAAWRTLLDIEPLYEDQEIVVYQTSPTRMRAAPETLLRFDDELGLADVQARRVRLLDQQFLVVDLAWIALDDLDRDYTAALSLVGATSAVGGQTPQAETLPISPHYPTSRWREGVVVGERYALPLDPALPAGDRSLAIQVADVASGEELDTQAYGFTLGADAAPLAPVLADIPYPVDVAFGDSMWLLGYDKHQESGRLLLDLYWQVLRTMGTNYKVFVHLIRPSDGAIVAQQDAMPRGWSYPTSLWSRQETFVDRVDLDIGGVAPGEYQLALGVYRPETGRLPAVDAERSRIPDDRVIAREPVVIQGSH